MKILVDEQLPPGLAHWLREQGCAAAHVREVQLQSSTDVVVWQHAAQTGATIITKDEDFVNLWLKAAKAVPVVWVRIGNCTNKALLQWFAPLWPEIRRRMEAGEMFIEIVR
ncbi:MAG: DUF5615 family PIN-like protein [Verrucomicrobiota bacterium]